VHTISAREDGTTTIRPNANGAPNVEDLEQLDELTLQDFDADFTRVEIPDHEGPWSEQEMQVAVHTFLDTLEGR